METTPKTLLYITVSLLVIYGSHFVQTMMFARAVTGSFFGSPGYVPPAPEWASISLIGLMIILFIDLGYLLISGESEEK